jgi:hypothetical protein
VQPTTGHLSAASVADSASPAPSSTGRPFQTSSPLSYGPSTRTTGTGFVVEIGSGSSSGPSGAPTASPFSMAGSAFSSASSPDDYLARPPHDPPPLETRNEHFTPNYASLPGLEGVDEGLIHSLFGPSAFGPAGDFGSSSLAGDAATNAFSDGINLAQDSPGFSAYPPLW